MSTHSYLHPLPVLPKKDTPTTLTNLVTFVRTTYAQSNHPLKYNTWLKEPLEKILPLQQRPSKEPKQPASIENATAGPEGVEEEEPVRSIEQNQNQGEKSGPAGTQNSTSQAPAFQTTALEREILQKELSGSEPPLSDRAALVLHIVARHFLTANNSVQQNPQSLYALVERIMTQSPTGLLGNLDVALSIVAKGLISLGKIHHTDDRSLPLILSMLNQVQRRSPKSLSAIHPVFLEICMIQNDAVTAKPIIDIEIEDLSFFKITTIDFLMYHYHAGLLYIELGDWEMAREMLEMTVTAPVESGNPCQLAAHKKLSMVNLIIDGKAFIYPKYISSAVGKMIREGSQLYDGLVAAFEQRDAGAVWTAKVDEFAKEGNELLLGQVQKAFLERQILDMTRIYSRIFVKDVRERLYAREGKGRITDEEVELIVVDLVSRGKLFAKIGTDTAISPLPYISFNHDPEEYNTKATVSTLEDLIKKGRDLGASIAQRDRNMGLQDEWVNRVVKREPTAAADAMGVDPLGMKVVGVKGVGANWADMGY